MSTNTPRRYWETFLVGNAIALLLIAVLWWNAPASADPFYLNGILLGLLVGHALACLVEVSGSLPKSKLLPRGVFFFMNAGLLILIGYFSRPMLFAYFASLGIMFSFESAVAALATRSKSGPARE